MSFYKTHVFVCENRRDNGECCCAAAAQEINGLSGQPGGAVRYMRRLLKQSGNHGAGRVRVNRAGCFDRCREGPVLVVYPAARWYRYGSAADLREIVERDVLQGDAVTRLQI